MPRKGTTTPPSDWWRRSLRGFAQLTFVQACIQLYNAFAVVDVDAGQQAAIMLVATPVVAAIQNWAEDNISWVPAVLKSPPSTGKKPAP